MHHFHKRILFFFAALLLVLAPYHTTIFADIVDIVYTWVDGSEPRWQEIRDTFYNECHPFLNNFDANTKNRYRNRDELKYSMRAVHEYADFVNHIYIVTFGQTPAWLKPHPKVTIIDHQQIFPDKSDLPTFNSQAIESNLHRIPNLAEKFIYLNDDVIFGQKLTVEDFFTKEGFIRVNLSEHKVPLGPVIPGECAYDSSWKNTNALLNNYFSIARRYKFAHAPFALTKSIMNEAEGFFPHVFRLVSSHKFRMPTDFTITNGLVQYYAYYTKRAVLFRSPSPMVRIRASVEKNVLAFAKLNEKNYKSFCVEDITEEDSVEVDKQVHDFFEGLFPTPAPWEKEPEPKPEPQPLNALEGKQE